MLPQAYEIDQTPLKMLAQLAEQEREYQRQRQILELKEEQNKIDLFGGAQKQILDMSSKLPYEMQRQFVAGAKPALKSILRSGVDYKTSSELVFETLTDFQSEVGGVNQWISKSKEVAKTLGEQGYDPTNVEAELNRHLYNIQTDPQTGQQIIGPPKKVSELGNFDEYLKSHVLDRPGMFWDMKKGMEGITKYTSDIKGSINKDEKIFDPTGTEKSMAAYQTELFPWTKYVEEKDPRTGMTVMSTVLDASPVTTKDGKPLLDSKGNPVTAISEDAYNKFVSANPSIKTTIEAGGQQLINEKNKREFGTIFPTKDQMDQGALDPDEIGNKTIYARLFLNNLPQMERFKMTRDVKSSKVKDNPKPVTINMPESEKPVSIQDRVNQVELGNPEFVGADGDVTQWFSFPIFGDDKKVPAKVLYDKNTKKYSVFLPRKTPKDVPDYTFTNQTLIDFYVPKIPKMGYTSGKLWRKDFAPGAAPTVKPELPGGFWKEKK